MRDYYTRVGGGKNNAKTRGGSDGVYDVGLQGSPDTIDSVKGWRHSSNLSSLNFPLNHQCGVLSGKAL